MRIKKNMVVCLGISLILLAMSAGIVTANSVLINQPPVPDANGPYVGVVGSSITLDASGSYDPDGFIVSWEWDIDGDGVFDDATGETVMWTWNNVHTGVVAVRVTDDAGDTDFDATTVTVNEGGGVEIPEFPTIALPIAAILSLAFFFQRRKD
ncbi:PEF-CTERM sorting domain-containing protein [Methanococcoides alaskense]|uniref:PKD/Chitinase domain-containing protein n=1 Tax=Methanococcoides alaskense TaxID=325778 RepID=A0AA90U217_9EURY|nr:PEF-CTERM sorting domain-containing protein [Methanococcoides alaskense]MDA0524285.1 PEF-CTERM sorting domain-containing protein [Methanococcoides alaskense]MDR6223764.1 hypothetical protein [Methanococcoides alaskense]